MPQHAFELLSERCEHECGIWARNLILWERDDEAENLADGLDTGLYFGDAVRSCIKRKASTASRTRLTVAMRCYVKSQKLGSDLLHFLDGCIGFEGCKWWYRIYRALFQFSAYVTRMPFSSCISLFAITIFCACENSWKPPEPDVEVGPSLGMCGLLKPCENVSRFAPVGNQWVRAYVSWWLRGARCHQYYVAIITLRAGLLGPYCWFVKPLSMRL